MGQNMRDSTRAWIVLSMLFLFMLINFADKAVIGLAALPIMKELHLTHAEFGTVGSAFFFLFSLSAILVGFLANHVSSKIVIAVMGLIWALAQFPMIGAVSLSVLMASRIVLGAGEGPAFPVSIHAAYKWFPNDRRPLPTGIVTTGAAIGLGVVAPMITWIILSFGWHAAFGALGIVGLIWVLIWMVVSKEGPLDARQIEGGGGGMARVPYFDLLTAPTVVGVLVGEFVAYYALALWIVWLPAFLVKVGGFTPTQVGWIIVLPAALQVVLFPGAGIVSQRLCSRGASSRVARGLLGGGCVAFAGVAMMLLSKSSGAFEQILLVTVAFSVGAVFYITGTSLIGEISPIRQRGAMLGICNAVYSAAGIIAPWIMGHIIDVGTNPAAGYRNGFLLGGGIVVVGGIVATILINPESDLARFRKHDLASRGGSVPSKGSMLSK